MSESHIAVEMDNLTEAQRQRDLSSSRDRSTTRSPQPRRRVARAVSEAEDDGTGDGPDTTEQYPGVDDGLLNTVDTPKRNVPRTANGGNDINRNTPSLRPNFTINEFTGRKTIIESDGTETLIPDVNAYQHKKTLAQGMMDLALLSANANQLRYVLESYKRHPYFYPSLISISLSIIFQVGVGVGLILNSRYNVKDEKEICKANRINDFTVIGIFIITVVNVFIAAFGVADAPSGT